MTSLESIRNKVRPSLYQTGKNESGKSALEEKIEELKQKPEFSGWSDAYIRDYALSILKKYSANINRLNHESAYNQLGHPLDIKWSQYSYEEILQMEDNGVKIPEEFLEWAHSMQSSNSVEYQLDTGDTVNENDADGLRTNIGDAGNMGMKDVAKVFAKQTQTQEEQITQAMKDFEPLASQMGAVQAEANSVQTNSMQKVQEYMNEWRVLDAKIKRGEELSTEEKALYGQLGILMNVEAKNCAVQVGNLTADFDEISKAMAVTTKSAKIAQDYAQDTSYIGGLIANYEAKHKSAPVAGGNSAFNGTAGLVGILQSNAVGKNLAVSAIASGNRLKTVTFEADNSIGNLTGQISAIASSVAEGRKNIVAEVQDGSVKADAEPKVGTEPETENPPETDVPPEEETLPPEATTPPPENAVKPSTTENNTLAEDEDPNNINTILKKELKEPPKPKATETIVV